jgi:hypothetical protein
MTRDKLSTGLASKLENVLATDMIDVVVELEQPAFVASSARAGGNAISVKRDSFSDTVAPVEHAIHEIGGEVLGRAWINSTVRARVPARSVRRLASLKSVERLDVPHKIEAEA